MNVKKMTIQELRNKYKKNKETIYEVIEEILDNIERDRDMNIWIYTLSQEDIYSYIENLQTMNIEEFPLWGIPFAIKDNIDFCGAKTTAACEEFSYQPKANASVVELLIEQGAIPIGKTNLDQFATGLVGTRSPYGEVHNALNKELISGGSSSGSAVAVARGHVAFSLGTDTAGSGRVPAALNGIVGFKPSVGAWSTRGVVPACESLDCVTVFANSIEDCCTVDLVVRKEDELSPWSKKIERQDSKLPKKILLPMKTPKFFGAFKEEYENEWNSFVRRLESYNLPIEYVDTEIFSESAKVLYDGPWVAERYAGLEKYLENHEETLLPVTKKIICDRNNKLSASELFKSIHFIQDSKKKVNKLLEEAVIIFPTVGGTFTRKEVRENPIETNSLLGEYTNHCNLLDLSSVAMPVKGISDTLPFGISVFSGWKNEHLVMGMCDEIDKVEKQSETVEIMVCGLHMRGFQLENQLYELGGKYSYTAKTAKEYRMYNIDTDVCKPGLIRCAQNGRKFEVEIWDIPISMIGYFLKKIKKPLGLGQILMENGNQVLGFICEGYCKDIYEDISEYGGWKYFSRRTEVLVS